MEHQTIEKLESKKPVTISTLEYLSKKGYETKINKFENQTFGDKIRSMSDEELAEMLCNTCTYNKNEDPMFLTWIGREIEIYHSYGDILKWLKKRRVEMERLTGEVIGWKTGVTRKNLADKLRLFENIGLTPQEIMELKERDEPMNINEIHVDEYYCPACGAENGCDQGIVGDKFCPACGQRLHCEGNDDL